MMKTVKNGLFPVSDRLLPIFIMNGLQIKNRNGKMNRTGPNQCERDGRMHGNGSDLKKITVQCCCA